MNPYHFARNLAILALACLALNACQTSPTTSNATSRQSDGRFILHRQPDLGVDILLSVDGKDKGVVRVADTYDSYLPPGQHTIGIIPAPNQTGQAASTATLTVEAGKTYSFIALRQGDNIALVRNP